MELFMQGEHFLRFREMAKSEGSEEVKMGLKRHSRKLGSKEKGNKLEVVQDADV